MNNDPKNIHRFNLYDKNPFIEVIPVKTNIRLDEVAITVIPLNKTQ